MMHPRDYVSFLVGAVIGALGALPLLSKLGTGPDWFALEFLPVQLFAYIVAAIGFYLMVNSVIEITNSNSIGWISFMIAMLFLVIGIFQVLNKFSIGPGWFSLDFISHTIYYVIFVIEGLFLMIAMFAMEI